jgi:hypothetical protein
VAELSFRDRFFTPRVARALTSPSGILALGAGAAIGIVATAPLSIPFAAVGAVVGGALGLGGRVALAIPRNEPGPRIDPFSVQEPWRGFVLDAIRARARFTEAIKTFPAGPLRDSLGAIDGRLDDALGECWRVAQQGQLLTDARGQIDDRAIGNELRQVQAQGGDDGLRSSTEQSLQAQLQSAQRMDGLIVRTRDELGLINARLDETTTQAIELSVSNTAGGVARVGASIDDIVGDLTHLREAMSDLNATDATVAGAGAVPDAEAATADQAPPTGQTLPPTAP